MKYILNAAHELVPCEDVLEWARWFERGDRIVASTKIAGFTLSTVCIGIPDQIFETAFFNPKPSNECSILERYDTWADAEAGHAKWLAIKRSEIGN